MARYRAVDGFTLHLSAVLPPRAVAYSLMTSLFVSFRADGVHLRRTEKRIGAAQGQAGGGSDGRRVRDGYE